MKFDSNVANVAENHHSQELQQTNRWPTLHSTFESTLSVVSQPGVRGGVVSQDELATMVTCF
jgi:hypothetical protein